MKISNERRAELYAAIHKPITDLRIKKLRLNTNTHLDDQLLKIEIEIWRGVKQSLNLEEVV